MDIFISVLLLIVGMILLIKGADFFVEGASNIAKALKIPSLIIGLTLVSIGTSAPELSVSVNSAIKEMNDMSFGNIVGSNVFNVLVVVGLSAVMIPLSVSKSVMKYDIPILIGIYLIIILFGFVISPNIIVLWESIIIFSLFIVYTVFLIYRGKKEGRDIEEENDKKKPIWLNIILVIAGLAGIIFGGTLTVDNASKIAVTLGMSEVLVGLTIVAVGTSLPELVTSVVAAKKGENDIAVGNAIGSSIFNIILILGLSSTISPMELNKDALVDVLVMLAVIILVFVFAYKSAKITKWQGIVMLLLYVVYLAYIIARNYM